MNIQQRGSDCYMKYVKLEAMTTVYTKRRKQLHQEDHLEGPPELKNRDRG